MLDHIFNSQTKTITGAAGILALSTLISRALGVVRDWLLAKNFGAGPELDIYFASFRIPDFIYNVLISGGIVVAFLPLFSEYFSKNKDEAWRFTNNILNVFLFLLSFFCLILFIFTPPLVKLFTPGFEPWQIDSTIFLTRIMFLSPLFLGLSSVFSGLLQYFNRFLVYSLAPILYNLGIIFGIILLAPYFGVLGVALGVIIGAFFHLIIQIPAAVKTGFRYKAFFDFHDLGLKRVFYLMIPRVFSIASQQINFIIVTAIASTLSSGSISIFNFANNIQNLPIGIIGISFAMAVFPQLSQTLINGKKKEFLENFSSTFRQVLYLIVPLTILMFIFRNQITEIVLRHGQFSKEAWQLTSASLGLYCLGMVTLALVPIILRAFFSLQDTKTPTLIAIGLMVFNIILSFYFSWFLLRNQTPLQIFLKNVFSLQNIKDISVLGLALAFSITNIFQFLLLMFFLDKKLKNFGISFKK